MSPAAQYRVAIEFGFPEKIVRRILQKIKFKDAGTFIEYLETHMEELKANAKSDEEVEKQETIKQATTPPPLQPTAPPPTSTLSLREETELLYRQSKCLVCRKNMRTFVSLPCCHFSLCSQCEPSARKCPLQSCQEKIDAVIKTYMF